MENVLMKRDSESQFEYVKRITTGKRDKTLDIDYSEWANLVYGQEYSSDVARRMFYGAERLIQVIGDIRVENASADEQISELKEKIRELEIKKVQYQDERRVNSKYMRPLARHERLLETIRDEISMLEPLYYDKESVLCDSSKQASLLISDTHIGIKCDNYWNKYNMDIAKDRLMSVVEDAIRYCKLFSVSTLHVELLGDLLSGAIHKVIELENESDVVKQTVYASELLSLCINELANAIPSIKIHMTVGNHSRVTPNKKDSVSSENFEYFIWEFLKLRVQRDDVEFVDNEIDESMICYEVNGEYIFGVHGHFDKVNKIATDFATIFNGKKIKAIHCGHLHHAYTNEINGISVVMNSTLSGTDTYAKEIRCVSNPSQTLLIYDGDNTLNFNLRA